MAGSCNRAGQRLEAAGAERGRAEAGVRLAALPAECQQPFQKLARGVGANALVLVKLYEAKTENDSRVLLRCAAFYLEQKRALERR